MEKILTMNMALNNIKSEYKDILNMKYLEKKPVKQIAKLLKKSESSIESILFRARQALKKEMQRISNFFE